MSSRSVKQHIVSTLLGCLLIASLFGCNLVTSTHTPSPSPSRVVQENDVRVMIGCFALSNDYPQAYVQNAINIVSSWLSASVKPGMPALHFYLNSLKAAGGDAADGSLFNLALPAIQALPPKPATTNPFDPKLTEWHKEVNAIEAQVQQVQQDVNAKLASLRSLSPVVSAPVPNGLGGCLADAHQVFSTPTERGSHILLLASPLYTLPQFGKDFLKDVTVIGMGMSCSEIATCDYKGYAARLYSFGARSVVLFNASQVNTIPSPLV